jgi:hypothetical protein
VSAFDLTTSIAEHTRRELIAQATFCPVNADEQKNYELIDRDDTSTHRPGQTTPKPRLLTQCEYLLCNAEKKEGQPSQVL